MTAELRDNPPIPSDEQLREWFDLAARNASSASAEVVDTISAGLRAVWRNGCDAGMVAP